MLIEQEVFFEGLDFEPIEFEYGFGKKTCYKGPENEKYTIVDEKNGWGKLKSGAGWINLNYTSR